MIQKKISKFKKEKIKRQYIIGRLEKGIDIVIKNNKISKKHAELIYFEKKFYITDLGSANGTYINNKKLSPQRRETFTKDDQIDIGTIITLTIESKSKIIIYIL